MHKAQRQGHSQDSKVKSSIHNNLIATDAEFNQTSQGGK